LQPGAGAERAFTALRHYADSGASDMRPFQIRPVSDLVANQMFLPGTVVLLDARAEDPRLLADRLHLWLDIQPAVLGLVFGLGHTGCCPALEALLRICTTDAPRRFWLARELAEVLSASGLGVIAREDHPQAAEIIFRIQQLYAGNYHFIDLLRRVQQASL